MGHAVLEEDVADEAVVEALPTARLRITIAGIKGLEQDFNAEVLAEQGQVFTGRGPCHKRRTVSEGQDFHADVRAEEEQVFSFRVSLDMPVGGDIVRAGELLMWDAGCRVMKPWSILLFSNGFYAIARSTGTVQSFAWSPFCILREEFTDKDFSGSAFSLSMVVQDVGFLLAARSEEAEVTSWVSHIARTLRTFTESCFPTFSMTVEPLSHMPHTATRILAGYLLHSASPSGCAISVPYCELQAPSQGQAHLAMYSSDTCEVQVDRIAITKDMEILDYDGVDCSCFAVGCLWLCAPGIWEKHLWLLELGRVKVQLMQEVPDLMEQDSRSLRQPIGNPQSDLWAAVDHSREPTIGNERVPISLPASLKGAADEGTTEELPPGVSKGYHRMQDVVCSAWPAFRRQLEHEDGACTGSSDEDEPSSTLDVGCDEAGVLPRTSLPTGADLHDPLPTSPRRGPTGPCKASLAPPASAPHAADTDCEEQPEV